MSALIFPENPSTRMERTLSFEDTRRPLKTYRN